MSCRGELAFQSTGDSIDLAEIFRPEDWLKFIQLRPFSRKWHKLDLDDDDLRGLEVAIMSAPTKFPVIEGTEGLRKIRFSGHKKARGKRGSERVCHVFSPEYGTVLLITVFGKNEQDDLTEVGKKAIANLIREIKVEFEKGTF